MKYISYIIYKVYIYKGGKKLFNVLIPDTLINYPRTYRKFSSRSQRTEIERARAAAEISEAGKGLVNTFARDHAGDIKRRFRTAVKREFFARGRRRRFEVATAELRNVQLRPSSPLYPYVLAPLSLSSFLRGARRNAAAG